MYSLQITRGMLNALNAIKHTSTHAGNVLEQLIYVPANEVCRMLVCYTNYKHTYKWTRDMLNTSHVHCVRTHTTKCLITISHLLYLLLLHMYVCTKYMQARCLCTWCVPFVVAGGDINYSAFIQAIDEEYTAQVYETEQKMEGVSLHAKDGADGSGVGGGAEEGARPGQVDVDMMVERIREHVDVNRIRVRGRGGEGRGGEVVKVEARNAVCVCT